MRLLNAFVSLFLSLFDSVLEVNLFQFVRWSVPSSQWSGFAEHFQKVISAWGVDEWVDGTVNRKQNQCCDDVNNIR